MRKKSDPTGYVFDRTFDNMIGEIQKLAEKTDDAGLQSQLSGLLNRVLVSPDKFWCRKIFVNSFITPKMEKDFPYIARDFLSHEYANISGYENISYFEYTEADCWPSRYFALFFLNLIVNAAVSGSEYSKALLTYLHKIYYKKDYKALKRFSSISEWELVSLSGPQDDNAFTANLARLLFIADISGIKMAPGCDLIYKTFEDLCKETKGLPPFECPGLTEDVRLEARKEINERFSDDNLLSLEKKHSHFLRKVLKSSGFDPEFINWCDEDHFSLRERMIDTLAILKAKGGDIEYSDDELAMYSVLDHFASAATCIASKLPMIYKALACSVNDDNKAELFKPEEVRVIGKPSAPSTRPTGTASTAKEPDREDMPRYDEKALLKEIDSLRLRVHGLETEVTGLHADLSGKKKREEECIQLSDELAAARKELTALRNYVYNLGDDDAPESKLSIDDMRSAIKDLHIIIVGGHPNWISKLKSEFPGWTYISAAVSGTTNTSIVDKADIVFFFTDTICHSRYYQFLNVLRERRIPFGYIHGVNIEKNITDIYNGIEKEG